MRSFTGLILLLAGIAVGAQAYYPDAVERHVHIAQLARVLTPAAPYDMTARDLQGETVRSFSPGRQLVTTGAAEQANSIKTVEVPGSPILSTAPKLMRTNGWETNVIQTAGTPFGGERAMSETDRWRLVRDLQSELRRAGCYWGRLDGAWGAGSKYAFQEFLLRVNASLPMTSPDPIMLTLVRSHPGTVCGKGCEDGYTKSANGRCLPYAITAENSPVEEPKVVAPVARLVRSGTVGPDVTSSTAFAQARHAYPEGRMSVGAPVHLVTPQASGDGIAPAVVLAAPSPKPYARPHYQPNSKNRETARDRKTKKSHRRASRAKQRRKALIRQAFGEGFD